MCDLEVMDTPSKCVEKSLYTEDRGIQVPMTLEYDNIVGTQCCDTLSHTSEDLTRELGRGFQIGVIRPIRVDFLKWL